MKPVQNQSTSHEQGLGRLLDYVGDRLELRHLVGAPFLIILTALLIPYFSGNLLLGVVGFLYLFYCPRRWMWFGFLGWAGFAFYLGRFAPKGLVNLQIVVIVSGFLLLAVSFLSYRASRRP